MKTFLCVLSGLIIMLCAHSGYTQPTQAEVSVWANEAIIATYSYDYKNYLSQQKEIARYFSSQGWMAYTKALDNSKLPEMVQKNSYTVSSVATQPPQLSVLDPTHWLAVMPILVVFKNSQSQQQQHLKIAITFTTAPSGQGVRGFSIISLQSTVIEPPCECAKAG